MISQSYSIYFKVYTILRSNPITDAILSRVRERYEMLCPAKESYIIRKSVQTLLITWLLILCEIVITIRISPGFVQTMIAITIAIILHHEVLEFGIHRLEWMILTQFEQFLSDVRHYYYVSRMVDEAIWEAMDQAPYEMRVHANKIHEIIISERCEELAEKYHLSSHNNFFNLFLALCVTVNEYGDRTVDNQSLFLMNLSHLKSEVNLELMKIKQINYLYAGLTFVIIAPMTILKVIETWAVSNLPELVTFYQEGIGYLTVLLIMLSSIIIYSTVTDLKLFRIHLPKDYLFIDCLLHHNHIYNMVENYICYRCTVVTRLRKLMRESGEAITLHQVIVMKFGYALMSGICCFAISIYCFLHEHDRYDWYELMITTIIATLSFHIPELKLRFHRKIAAMGKEEEIIRYQSIVLMLMYIERVSVIEILERVEEFSCIFRNELQNCINDYNHSDLNALIRLKESTDFLPLQRFVDNLLISDEIGIEKAFDEIASDRQHFQDKRKQDNEMNLNKRSELAKFLSYIPAILVIGAYLILPFLIECYHQLKLYQEAMNSMM